MNRPEKKRFRGLFRPLQGRNLQIIFFGCFGVRAVVQVFSRVRCLTLSGALSAHPGIKSCFYPFGR